MTEKQAYCCLNCTASANCCGACGECPACCKDCGDTSMCRSSAYFKDGSFYLNYTSNSSISLARNQSDNSSQHVHYISSNATYNSKTNKCSSSGSARASTFSDDGDKTSSQSSCSGDECFSCGCVNDDECWICAYDVRVQSATSCCAPASECCGYSSNSCGPFCVDDTCSTFDHGCSGLGCICDEYDGCEGTFESKNTATVTFQDPVKLYNSEGEDVGNIIGANYDPCNPCATWGAPGCHFFHP